MDYCFGNPNSNPNYGGQNSGANNMVVAPSPSEFMLSDYLLLDDVQECWSQSQSTESSENKAASSDASCHSTSKINNNNNIKQCKNGIERNKEEVSQRVVFRTRSELEIMDDGYKWRKYGKKSVKNSPNPRNYYKCSSEGCGVKKRVERDRDDPSYVLTTYDGVHTHESASNSYYTHISFLHSNNDHFSPLPPSAISSSSSNSFPRSH